MNSRNSNALKSFALFIQLCSVHTNQPDGKKNGKEEVASKEKNRIKRNERIRNNHSGKKKKH